MAQRSTAQRRLVYALALTSLAGCSSLNSLIEGDKLDYRSASKAPSVSLEVPPDLTQLQRDSRYAIPEANSGTATASTYNATFGSRAPAAATTAGAVAPNAVEDMRIERDGRQRWLVVKRAPEALWPQLKDFWQDNGFLINVDSPQTGVMETDWAENRAKIPEDIIRRTLGKVFDSLYSTGERDKFRTRVERGPNGMTEIYISHRGAQEVLKGRGDQSEGTVWTTRPSDPELEAEFLSRLMTRLGSEATRAKAVVASAPAQQAKAKLVKGGGGAYVEVDEAFDRAWRRVGLALDRVGFTVEDRDRGQGIYFVRYVDQDADAQGKGEKGFFSRLLSFGSDDDKSQAQRYRILVKGVGAASQVSVQNNEGKPETSQTGEKILALLNDQLK
ncbi:MAG TPA: outer membrane protein assembly factor BamC [Paucimonas sp.]|nr:outer membrane protein assembly factor BamC [Paucimonas sp.]